MGCTHVHALCIARGPSRYSTYGVQITRPNVVALYIFLVIEIVSTEARNENMEYLSIYKHGKTIPWFRMNISSILHTSLRQRRVTLIAAKTHRANLGHNIAI